MSEVKTVSFDASKITDAPAKTEANNMDKLLGVSEAKSFLKALIFGTDELQKDKANGEKINEASEEGKKSQDVKETPQVVQNKLDGCRREKEVEDELRKQYPENEGYQIVKEAYLRDENGNFVIDPETGEKRRIDFIVVKDGVVVKSVEVTSLTASKDDQIAKENRIRENGGNYIKDNNGILVRIPDKVKTEVERRT